MPASADPRGGVLFYPGLSGGVFLGFCPAWASPESTPCMAEPQLLRKKGGQMWEPKRTG